MHLERYILTRRSCGGMARALLFYLLTSGKNENIKGIKGWLSVRSRFREALKVSLFRESSDLTQLRIDWSEKTTVK